MPSQYKSLFQKIDAQPESFFFSPFQAWEVDVSIKTTQLKSRIQDAVENEDYAEAARLKEELQVSLVF
jgi:hypothetical protein